tara:strand:+ start:1557 stop:2033 length:477 start_codon:yes stop_codon:yes gene_type:complete
LKKEEALAQGFNWKDTKKPQHPATIQAENIPDNIKDVDESILKEILECEHKQNCSHECAGAFKIIPQELQFLKRFNLPIPHLCVSCRHYERIKKRNTMKLYDRACTCAGEKDDSNIYKNIANHMHHSKEHCENKFQTAFAPDRKEIIYCEACYQAEVV